MNEGEAGGRSWLRWLVVIIPYAWSLLFFLIPFLIVFKISFSTSAIAQPPYTPVFNSIGDFWEGIKQFSFDNYVWLTQDSLYWRSYISSIVIAVISTFLVLLVGFPMAYGMARAPRSWQPTLVMLVILPFWTSFLIRVYAWIGILKKEGLLQRVSDVGARHQRAADHPQHQLGGLHRHRLFLPPVHGAAALRDA